MSSCLPVLITSVLLIMGSCGSRNIQCLKPKLSVVFSRAGHRYKKMQRRYRLHLQQKMQRRSRYRYIDYNVASLPLPLHSQNCSDAPAPATLKKMQRRSSSRYIRKNVAALHVLRYFLRYFPYYAFSRLLSYYTLVRNISQLSNDHFLKQIHFCLQIYQFETLNHCHQNSLQQKLWGFYLTQPKKVKKGQTPTASITNYSDDGDSGSRADISEGKNESASRSDLQIVAKYS